MPNYNAPRFYFKPSAASTWAKGLSQGLNQGLQNMQNYKLRKMQMEALQMQRQAMARNAEANMAYKQAMAQRYAPSDTAKVQLALDAYNHPGVPKDVSGPLLKQQVKQAFDNAQSPEQVAALQQQFQGLMVRNPDPGTGRAITEGDPNFRGPPSPDSMLQGQPAMQSSGPLNYSENQDFQKGLQEQGRNSRNAATNSTGLQKANISGQYSVQAAQARGSDAAGIRAGGQPSAPTNIDRKAYWQQYNNTMKAWNDADKPNPVTGMAPPADEVAARRTSLKGQADQILNQIHGLGPEGQQTAPQAAPQGPVPRPDAKVINWGPDAKSQARPGDLYKFGDGTMHIVGDDKGNAVSTPYQPPQQTMPAMPQAAPQAAMSAAPADVPPPPPAPTGTVGVMGY